MDSGYGHCVKKMTCQSFPFKGKAGMGMGVSFTTLFEIAFTHPRPGPPLEREGENFSTPLPPRSPDQSEPDHIVLPLRPMLLPLHGEGRDGDGCVFHGIN